ncbi:MAG TPA: ABC transporter permease [Clostridiales bacterium]|nr:ABC transporter permease [Clostridiales bacterium]
MKLNRIGYLIKSGFKGIFSHGLMSFASVTIIMACLIIMGSFSLLIVNINNIIDDLENENEVVAFVDENLSDEAAQALQADIEALQNISGVRFVSREDARTSFEEDYDKSLFSDIDSSVFRHRYVINLADISLMGDTKAALESVDGIAKVNAHLEYAKGFITVRNIVSVVSLVLIILLTAVSLLIMTNTIKLATFTRREEIAIMKMVGASNGFIRCPFVVEGLVLGLLGGGLAFLLEWGIYVLVCNKIVTGVTGTLISVVAFSTVMWPLLIAFMAAGVLVGVIGGMTAIRNYLKV